jgi:hypothetical protein
MYQLFNFKTPIADMHQYPIGTQHLYCFESDKFKNGLLSMNAIERTFIKDNKQYWREVARANISVVKSKRASLASLYKELDGNEPEGDQVGYVSDLISSITTHLAAFNIAYQRRVTGFGLEFNDNKYAKSLKRYFLQLRDWELIVENTVFRGNVLEDALGIMQKEVFYTEPHQGCCGIHNGAILKEILATINVKLDSKDYHYFAISADRLSERLALLVSRSGYTSPKYNLDTHFLKNH